jgi:hypothetical protein
MCCSLRAGATSTCLAREGRLFSNDLVHPSHHIAGVSDPRDALSGFWMSMRVIQQERREGNFKCTQEQKIRIRMRERAALVALANLQYLISSAAPSSINPLPSKF